MKVVGQEEVELIKLLGHVNSFNKRLVEKNVGARNIEVALGIAEANAICGMHYHPEAEQVLSMLEGVLRIRGENSEEIEFEKSMAMYIPLDEGPQPYNPTQSRSIYLVINLPPVSTRMQ
jgi:uncharacterized RmlC-like cupin family protein